MLLVVAGGWKNWSRDFNASSDFLINLKPSRHFDLSDLRNLLELWNEKSDTIKKKSWKIETKIKFSSKQIMIHLFWRETFFLASTHVNGISSRRKKVGLEDEAWSRVMFSFESIRRHLRGKANSVRRKTHLSWQCCFVFVGITLLRNPKETGQVFRLQKSTKNEAPS